MGCLCHAWKSSAMAIKEIPKGVFLCLERKNRRLFVSKPKNVDQICLDEKLKSFTMTKSLTSNSITTASSKKQ